jgi:hypothetical protein
MTWDLTGLLSLRRKVCCGFLSPLKIHRLGRVRTANFGSSVKHTNHYTNKAALYGTIRFIEISQLRVYTITTNEWDRWAQVPRLGGSAVSVSGTQTSVCDLRRVAKRSDSSNMKS